MTTRIIVLTSNALRHKYFANSLTKVFDVIHIYAEEKIFNPKQCWTNTKEKNLLNEYFSARDKSEEKYFCSHSSFHVPRENVDWLSAGKINDDKIVENIIKKEPKFLVVFGTSIIREKLIKAFCHRVINMHLGLSPYYRGSGTNFWPLYDGKPECVGVTIHFMDEGVDSGAIIIQGRPHVSVGDDSHDLGNKTIIKGAGLMIETLKRMNIGKVSGIPQSGGGKLCLRKHFKAEHLTVMLENVGNGLIEDYITHKDVRDKAYPIVEWGKE